MVGAAERYTAGSGELCVVTTFFDSVGYARKRENLELFAKPILAAGIPLVVVECAFGSSPYTQCLPGTVTRVRARDVMWQKERLINLAVSRLPTRFTKIAWIDADVLFANHDWLTETEALLDEVPIVQLFNRAYRLPQDTASYRGSGSVWSSFAYEWQARGPTILRGDFDDHGHTGFAWAARREIFTTYGLFDSCIAGGADHVMAHVMCGDWSSFCLSRSLGDIPSLLHQCRRWAAPFFGAVQGRVACVSGSVLHLWHGEDEHRQYDGRFVELARIDFDPTRDLRLNTHGCWQWAMPNRELRHWARTYFEGRLEDGPSGGAI